MTITAEGKVLSTAGFPRAAVDAEPDVRKDGCGRRSTVRQT